MLRRELRPKDQQRQEQLIVKVSPWRGDVHSQHPPGEPGGQVLPEGLARMSPLELPSIYLGS